MVKHDSLLLSPLLLPFLPSLPFPSIRPFLVSSSSSCSPIGRLVLFFLILLNATILAPNPGSEGRGGALRRKGAAFAAVLGALSDGMAHDRVPKFGSWEDEGQEAVSKDPPSIKASPLRTGLDPGVPKPKDERCTSREDDLPWHEATARKPHAESPNHRYGDYTNYDNAAKKTSTERSPMHPRHQARIANKGGVSSPSWDRRGSSQGNRGTASTTPGRSKNKSSGRGDETPERGSAVPKFGEWDEKDPSTGEGFTDIFDKVREEKQSGNAPIIPGHADYMNRSNQGRKYESSGCSCFSWFKN